MQNAIPTIALIAAYSLQNKAKENLANNEREEWAGMGLTKEEKRARMDVYLEQIDGIHASNEQLAALLDSTSTAHGFDPKQGKVIMRNICELAETAIFNTVFKEAVQEAKAAGRTVSQQEATQAAVLALAISENFIANFDWTALPVDITAPLSTGAGDDWVEEEVAAYRETVRQVTEAYKAS